MDRQKYCRWRDEWHRMDNGKNLNDDQGNTIGQSTELCSVFLWRHYRLSCHFSLLMEITGRNKSEMKNSKYEIQKPG